MIYITEKLDNTTYSHNIYQYLKKYFMVKVERNLSVFMGLLDMGMNTTMAAIECISNIIG